MKKLFYLLPILTLVLGACEFRQSINKDVSSGMSTRGDGLSCDQVVISVNDQKVTRDSFVFGETFWVNFVNLEGLVRADDAAHPKMKITVTSQSGETALHIDDAYNFSQEGIAGTPLNLSSRITIGDPMKSGERYHLNVEITDHKGDGRFTADFDFSVEHGDHIEVSSSDNADYQEVYMYCEEPAHFIFDTVKSGEQFGLLFAGVEGFTVTDGRVHIGMSLTLTDAAGNVLVQAPDLFPDETGEGLPASDFQRSVQATLTLTDAGIEGPVTVSATLYDKKSSEWVMATTKVAIESVGA